MRMTTAALYLASSACFFASPFVAAPMTLIAVTLLVVASCKLTLDLYRGDDAGA